MITGDRVYGLGAILLGLIGLAFADFALQWQPAPEGLPSRTLIAYASGALLAGAGAALFHRRFAVAGAGLLALMYAVWVVALHGPRVLANPADVSVWLGVAEIGALAMGGLIAFVRLSSMAAARRAQVVRLARMVFALCLLVFGLSHFVYADFTASMIPKWIPPSQMSWAYLTGLAHVLAGVGILMGRYARLAARLLVGMFAGFIALLLIPLVLAKPHDHASWIMLAITVAMAGAAWIVADSLGGRRS